MDEVFAEVTLPRADRVSDWGDVLDTVARVRDTLEVFRPEIFDIPLGELVAATGTKQYREDNGVALGWYARWRLRRQARSLLRPGTPPADLHAAMVDAQHQRLAWHQMAGAGGRPEIPVDLDRARTAYESVAADLRWLGSGYAPTTAGGDLLATGIPELQERMAALAARPERLAVLPRVLGTLDALRATGMGPLVDDMARRGRRGRRRRLRARVRLVDVAGRAPHRARRGLRRPRRRPPPAHRPRVHRGRPRPPEGNCRARPGGRTSSARGPGGVPRPGVVGAGRGPGKARRHRPLRDMLPAPVTRSPPSSRRGP